ncbi:ATP-binding cassette subfamily B protein [Hydrogenispora ethanolica]|uniref:ATP-binding cassette subfamily B protein n=1 Tax=Hydrogenispora ethanolica TaxID=1082276 RepID=A0A4R1S293_HYDET|nr:ABC transporter ATP-binding protein [Hydrogenispora ethanolica]TCL73293.1 ATP-binding cassette subfamily B protein [Hydrogenispora ethanolica]
MKENNFMKEFKKKGRLSSVLTSVSVIAGMIPIFVVMLMVGFLSKGNVVTGSIWALGALICLCQAVKAVFYALAIWKAHDSAYSSLAEIRLALIEHLRNMTLRFFQKRKTGDLANIINHDVERVELYLAHTLPEVVITNVLLAVIFISVMILDWRLGLAMISTIPLVFLAMYIFNKLWTRMIEKYHQSVKTMSEDLMEYIATIPAIKAFSKDEKKTEQVLDSLHAYIAWAKKATIGEAIPMSFIMMLLEGGMIVLTILGSILLRGNQIDMVKFILAVILGGQFSEAFARLMSFEHSKAVFKNTMATIDSVMGVEPEEENEKCRDLPAGDIEFKNIHFSYDGEKKALEDINLVFQKNTVNAIVGPSGSGKSTLANLLMGFWKADGGKITIGGKSIDAMHERDLSALVSIVQQEVFLFNTSIAENIRIGKKDAGREEVIEAAKKAQIHDMIMSLPRGYETAVGEAGARLSGGEKQRISIARMILKNAPVVILDEATAAIDPYHEYLIQKAISNLGKNKTLIIIAHHLNTITHADQILVMEDGRIKARGKHEELLKSSRMYQAMVKAQNEVDGWQIKEAKAL